MKKGGGNKKGIPLLFIGGSKDGLRIEIKDDKEEIYFYILPKQEIVLWEEKEKIPDRITYKQERYKCHRIGGNSCIFKVMVIENFTGDTLIESLIENYNPKKLRNE